MALDVKKLGAILIKENYISSDELSAAEEYATSHDGDFREYLIAKNLLSPNLLAQAIAEAYKVPFVDILIDTPDREVILELPEEIARKYRAILLTDVTKKTLIATDDPGQPDLAAAVGMALQKTKVSISCTTSQAIDELLNTYQKSLENQLAEIFSQGDRVAPKVLDVIFHAALADRTSDIHFDPQFDRVVIRFRVDGVLHQIGSFPLTEYDTILNRVKVLSSLRIDEHFAAQDGAISYEFEKRRIDIRTSIMPTVLGEKIVLRVLASYIQELTLDLLGLSEELRIKFEEASDQPFGMILVVGPTGSGKTTTLYALLKQLNQPTVNVMTIEDPVEYHISHVNQIQVNPEANLDFSQGLRSIIRQDPDIILVGEIRDKETANIAVNAALTGHLLLSTFHANDAATAIPRLLTMGIEPFMLASTLNVVLAQRLIRTICTNCRISEIHDTADLKKTYPALASRFTGKNLTLYRGKGCGACGDTGYKGRTAIFEFIMVTPPMRELILRNPSAQEIDQLALSEGTRSLFEDGWSKVLLGTTTVEELLRVSAIPVQPKNSTPKAGV